MTKREFNPTLHPSPLAIPTLPENEGSHIRVDVISSRFTAVRVGGGHGQSFGSMIDSHIGQALEMGERVSNVSIVITEEDWHTLETANHKGDDVSIKTND